MKIARSESRRIRCFFCQQEGHIQVDCPKRPKSSGNKGVQYRNADSLSRRPSPEDCKHCARKGCKTVETVKAVQSIPHIDTRSAQEADPDIAGKLVWEELADRLHKVHEMVKDQLRIASDRMKTRDDVRTDDVLFDPGDKVWLYNPTRKKGRSPKLQSDWEGPCVIEKRINDVVYRIRHGKKLRVVHRNRLAAWCSDRDGQN